MVMLGSADNASQWGRQVAQPDEIGMRETQSPCVIVADADAHYARAKAAGASIVMDIADKDYGGRGYACRDRSDEHTSELQSLMRTSDDDLGWHNKQMHT